MSDPVISQRLPWWAPWLAMALLLSLLAFTWLRPFLNVRSELSRLAKLDEASLSKSVVHINVNTYDHEVPEWSIFHLRDSTLDMLQARYGRAALKHYQSVIDDGPWCGVVSMTDPSHGPHHFKLSAGTGNDSVFYRLEHLPGPFDPSGMNLVDPR